MRVSVVASTRRQQRTGRQAPKAISFAILHASSQSQPKLEAEDTPLPVHGNRSRQTWFSGSFSKPFLFELAVLMQVMTVASNVPPRLRPVTLAVLRAIAFGK